MPGVKENRTSSVKLFCSVLFSRTQNRTEHQRKMSYRTQNRTEQGRKNVPKMIIFAFDICMAFLEASNWYTDSWKI